MAWQNKNKKPTNQPTPKKKSVTTKEEEEPCAELLTLERVVMSLIILAMMVVSFLICDSSSAGIPVRPDFMAMAASIASTHVFRSASIALVNGGNDSNKAPSS